MVKRRKVSCPCSGFSSPESCSHSWGSPPLIRIRLVQESLGKIYQMATSKRAQRAIVHAGLLVGGSLPLLLFAAVATILFYHNYLPDQVIKIPIHLQYE